MPMAALPAELLPHEQQEPDSQSRVLALKDAMRS
jgi:hypothetical protein